MPRLMSPIAMKACRGGLSSTNYDKPDTKSDNTMLIIIVVWMILGLSFFGIAIYGALNLEDEETVKSTLTCSCTLSEED